MLATSVIFSKQLQEELDELENVITEYELLRLNAESIYFFELLEFTILLFFARKTLYRLGHCAFISIGFCKNVSPTSQGTLYNIPPYFFTQNPNNNFSGSRANIKAAPRE